MDLDNLYQELIIDHGTEPRNHRILEQANHDAEGYNPLCGDKIHVYLQIENDTIKDISFMNVGCAISTASASIMSEVLKGKTVHEANDLFQKFQHLVTTDTEIPSVMGKLSALSGVRKYPARVKCATLAWHTLASALHSKRQRNG